MQYDYHCKKSLEREMKNNLLSHIDTWLKLTLTYFDKHTIQATLFIAALTIWSIVINCFFGLIIFDRIVGL